MKKHRLGIIGVVSLIITFILTFNINVYAKSECDNYVSNLKTQCKKYNPEDWVNIEKVRGKENDYKINMTDSAPDVTMGVESVTVGTHSYTNITSKQVTKKTPLTLTITPEAKNVSGKTFYTVKVNLEVIDVKDNNGIKKCLGIYNDAKQKKCKIEGSMQAELMYEYAATSLTDIEVSDEVKGWLNEKAEDSEDGHPIFKEIKAEYIKYGKKYGEKDERNQEVRCNPRSTSKKYVNGKEVTDLSGFTDDYYTNLNYYYSSGPEPVANDDLVYEFENAKKEGLNKKTIEQKNYCKKTCEEIVKVEYGPPVASYAGACFEYKVKVTSYIKCKTHTEINKPDEKNYKTCPPTPKCVSKKGSVNTQGGPNEDFEKCIKNCDGGKYTRNCSNKCYNKVYKNTKIKKTSNSAVPSAETKKLSNSKHCSDSDGCYYRKNGGKIYWEANGKIYSPFADTKDKMVTHYGRWYGASYDPHAKYKDHQYYVVSSGEAEGIWKATNCTDDCSWDETSCPDDSYLNPSNAEKDLKEHARRYKEAVKSCKAAASCSTHQTEITISADYQQSGKQKETKNYKNATLLTKKECSDRNDKNTFTDADNIITVKNPNVTENPDKTVNGCYDNCKEKNWYQTEWTFPGSWLTNKAGEVVLDNPHDETNYITVPKKFCIPNDNVNQNPEWWEWNEVQKEKDTCVNPDELTYNYNIKASTKDFGHFNWDIDIKCFYALRNEECVPNDNNCCPEKPAKDGQKTDSSTATANSLKDVEYATVSGSKINTNVKDYERDNKELPWNWQDVTKVDNDDYLIDPTKLMMTVETRKVTNDDTRDGSIAESLLEYRFVLTKDMLKRIKGNFSGPYTDFKGTFTPKKLKNGGKINFYNSGITSSQYGMTDELKGEDRYKNYIHWND